MGAVRPLPKCPARFTGSRQNRFWLLGANCPATITQMKTILMLIVGLMLADCGSMENVRNAPPVLRDRGDTIAVGVICACP